MKQFSLEEYIKNPSRKIVTRDGKEARIVCTDKKGRYPIIALSQVLDDDDEEIHSYTKSGKMFMSIDSNADLFFAPEKHEGWVNVYKDGNMYSFGDTHPYATEKEAKRYSYIYSDYVCTIKVEWKD